jgi:LmbE family N-acetylglucosaminyl deacetylase
MQKRAKWVVLVVLLVFFPVSGAFGQDPRLKLDALLIVAHSDDETILTPYLARLAFDQKKRVGVAFIGTGGGGWNQVGRERGQALGMLRRMESDAALRAFGIEHIWFVGDRLDGGTSNPLVTLASAGHGALLERVVRIVRATQPDVLFSWLPAQVIGENHGEHQAAGVIAAEAFDRAGDPTAFPGQLASYGNGTESLLPWTVRKLYYVSDAFDPAILDGAGPTYSVHDVSPSRKRTYLSLAAAELAKYPTQFTDDLAELFGVTLDEITRAAGTPAEAATLVKLTQGSSPFWFEPTRMLRARSRVGGSATEDVFSGLDRPLQEDPPYGRITQPAFEIGGPWAFSRQFREKYRLEGLSAIAPQIALARGGQPRVSIPLRFTNLTGAPVTVRLVLETPPEGWSEAERKEYAVLPHATIEPLSILSASAAAAPRWTAVYRAEVNGVVVGRASIVLQVTDWTVPQ